MNNICLDISESIEKKLNEMKHQLGLDSVKSQNEKYIERMKGITEKLENKDFSSKNYLSSQFDNTFGTEEQSYHREKMFFKDADSTQIHNRSVESRYNDSKLNETISR